MPNIDVTELFTDPDFADNFMLTRVYGSVDAGGINRVTRDTPVKCTGVVTPATTNDLRRMPEGSTVQGAIAVKTTVRLSPGGQSTVGPVRLADEIMWNGAAYTVRSCNDWTNFGAGWVDCVCEMNPIAGQNG